MKNRLKELRIEKGLTQDELASYLKVARSNISKYEQGTVDLSNEFLIQLSNFFNVTTDYLLGLSDIRDPYEVETIAAHKDGEEWKHIQAEVKIIPINSLNLVFPSSKGTHIQNTAPDKPLERVITKHNFKKITPHGFRHSHCCHLFDAGASIKEVMDRLGHKDIKITMEIYNHVTEFRKKDTLVKYEDYLQSVSKVCQIK